MTEDQRAHLSLIQGVVTRQAGNAFLVKGWALTVSVALYGFSIGRRSWPLALLALLPALVFAWLDAYFFRQERLFRCLYEAVVAGDPRVPPFSMNARIFARNESALWSTTLRSMPFVVLYSAVLIAGVVVTIAVGQAGNGNDADACRTASATSSLTPSDMGRLGGQISPMRSSDHRGTKCKWR
ncbi:MAG TPA: hypothetical protein VHD81_03970 [Mycobacteriales bacterium]|nr:hypothetical protein [Mycobacteriales bacterium]